MKAILGYGISFLRDSSHYRELVQQYPWLSISDDNYLQASAVMNDAIGDEELEADIWYEPSGTEDGIIVCLKGSLQIKADIDFEIPQVEISSIVDEDTTSIVNFCSTIGEEPQWILLCVNE